MFDQENKKVQKIGRKLAFQNKFSFDADSLSAGIQGTNEYELKAVIAHRGMSVDEGHYVCYARHENKWFIFNDDQSAVIDEEEIAQLAGGSAGGFIGYVFLYEQKQAQQ